jgi:hypothetical protein
LEGATTLSITTLGIMTLSIMGLNATFIVTTLSKSFKCHYAEVFMLSIVFPYYVVTLNVVAHFWWPFSNIRLGQKCSSLLLNGGKGL